MGGIVLGASFFLLGVILVVGRDPRPLPGLVCVALGIFVLLLGLQREDAG